MSAGMLRGLLVVLAALALAAPAHAETSVLDNGTVRVAVDLAQGGKLTWLSRAQGEHADNLLVESEQSYYSGPFTPDGSPLWHGFQDAAKVIAHSNDGRTVYDRAVWDACECVLDTWVTLNGNSVTVRNRLIDHRTDGTRYAPGWQELPALYTEGPYRVVTYDGFQPWTHAPTADLTDAAKFPFFTPMHVDMLASEHWAALVDDTGFGVGLVEPDLVHMIGISGNGYPTGYLAGVRPELIDANATYSYTYTLVVGTVAQIRNYAYAHRPDPRPHYVFARDRQHFTEVNATDNGFPISGALRVHVDPNDPQLVGPEQEWRAAQAPRLYIRGAWHTKQRTAQLFWGLATHPSFAEGESRTFDVIPNGQFHTYRIDLFRSPTYTGLIDGIRLDPVVSGEPGAWVDITCISYRPCPVDRTAERRLASDGSRIPLLDTFDTLDGSLWSITGNSTGAGAAVADGKLRIEVGPDAQPLPGQTFISAGVYSRCRLAGDFVAQVDYFLDQWPETNGVNVNFSVGNATVFRHNGKPGEEWISAYFPPGGSGLVYDPDPVGQLRVRRAQGVVSGYFRNADGDWQLLAVANSVGPVNVGLSIYAQRPEPFTQDVRVAFDDFRVTRGTLDCQ